MTVPNFDFTTGNPDNLIGGSPAAMTDIQGPLYDLRSFLNAQVVAAINGANVFVTSLPAAPADGQEAYYVADAAKGVVWHLIYRADDPSAYKWQCVGGPPVRAEWSGSDLMPAGGFDVFPLSHGPQVAVPLPGEYLMGVGCRITPVSGGSASVGIRFGTAAIDNTDIFTYQTISGSPDGDWFATEALRTIAAAATVARMEWQCDQSTGYANRSLAFRPVRVKTP
jgi:hypothetical protein